MKSRIRVIAILCSLVIAPLTYEVDAHGEEALDISGSWLFQVDTDLGSGSPTITFKQEGENLTGEYDGTFGKLPLSGTIKDHQINFSFITKATGQDETIVYSGSVEQNTMKGDIQLGGAGSGTFLGKRELTSPSTVNSSAATEPVQKVKRSLGELLTPEIRAVAPAEVAALLNEVDVRRDVKVAETPEKTLLLDVYSPKGRQKSALPCAVWIHGGGLTALSKDYDLIRWCAAYTARAGFVSMSIDYRLRPEAELPAAIIDAKTAVRYVRAHAKKFGIDPNRIAVAGESAGGYLATFVAFAPGIPEFQSKDESDTPEDVKCAVIWYTPAAWKDLKYHSLEYISKEDPPALFIHGDSDSLVDPADSKIFADRYQAVGAEAELMIIQNAEHGFFDVNSNVEAYKKHMTDALDASVAFLNKHIGN